MINLIQGDCLERMKEIGRSFIGIELDEEYFKIASDRIEGAVKGMETL